MANRPIFVPLPEPPFVAEKRLDFAWSPGLSVTQARKSIASLHEAAARLGISPLLDISSKSPAEAGQLLSAFNLTVTLAGHSASVECLFQGSKVFRDGGPYVDLYQATSRDAKLDPRLKSQLTGFRLGGEDWPLTPVTAFYDWIYLQALRQNPELAERLIAYAAFSDIVFNPSRSLNCQARAAAVYVGLNRSRMLRRALEGKENYLEVLAL